jgi:DnaJ-class molecular chaperone
VDTWLLIPIGAVWAAGYLIACAVWPYTNCASCDGSAKKHSPTGRAFRVCGRCEGSGRRVRLGRRIHDHFSADHAGRR